MRRIALLTVAALLPVSAQAGPWAQGKGRTYLKLGAQRLRSTTLAHPDGTQSDIPRFFKDEVAVYVSHGLSDRWSAYGSAPLWRSSDLADIPDELGRESGFGDAQAGLQLQLGARAGWTFAVRGTVQAPTGDETRAQGLQPTGSGVWEGEALVGAGRSLGGGRGWGFVEAGPQFRGGGLRDGLSYGGQVGWTVTPRLALAIGLRGAEPWSTEAPSVALGSFVGVGDRVTYLTVGPTAIVTLAKGLGVQVDVESILRARNLARGPLVRVGLSLSR
jgi:hypothetical protein